MCVKRDTLGDGMVSKRRNPKHLPKQSITTAEEITAAVAGGFTFLNVVVPVITFWWRFAFLAVFVILLIDLCLRSRRMQVHSPEARLCLSLLVAGTINGSLWNPMRKQYLQEHMPQSFLFLMGAPLGDNDSPVWVMNTLHYGPSSAYNCNLHFIDQDRYHLQHDWLTDHPGETVPEFIRTWDAKSRWEEVEPAPTLGIFGFKWVPINPDQQHYQLEIICRDGEFAEAWEVTRVNGVLRTHIDIERSSAWVDRHPEFERLVFICTDPDFVMSPQAELTNTDIYREVPKIDPGWKPSHIFIPPVEVLADDNNYHALKIQTINVGCWDILYRHLGDVSLPFTVPDNPMALPLMIYGFVVLVLPLYGWFAFWWMGVEVIRSKNERT
jgi:hypothetical protein